MCFLKKVKEVFKLKQFGKVYNDGNFDNYSNVEN